MAPRRIWHPSAKQAEFLSATSFECLFGGAAGGGKTEGLIIGAAGLNYRVDGVAMRAIDQPRYWALLIRRYATDLKQLEERCKSLYEDMEPRVKHNKATRTFIFPSGARIELTHGDSEDMVRNKYKGGEFQYVGWEELTEHPIEAPYTYLLTRMRRASGMPNGFPVVVRATTNPDGPGNDWVKERWRIADTGHSVETFEERGRTRQFIQARVWDNPHVDPGYEITLRAQSEQRMRALLEGRWDVVEIEGSIYKSQYRQAILEGRVGVVPIESRVPINTFWDIGRSDATAIWFHQRVGLQDRFVDYFESNHEALDFYVRVLKDRGYLYGTHYLPHDAGWQQLGTHQNKSVEQMLNDLELRPTTVVERIPNISHGIEITRLAWPSCWFDKDRCAQGIKALKFYRFKISPTTGAAMERPHHDWYSHGADAFRTFAQGFRGNRMRLSEYLDQDNEIRGYSRNRRQAPQPKPKRRPIYG